MGGLSFNLLDQLTFYGSYHSNKWNQIIHFFCVPAIVWSLLVWCAYTGPLFLLPKPTFLPGLLVPSLGAIIAVAYSIFYILLDVGAGLSWTICIALPLFFGAQAFAQVPHAWVYAIAVHVFGWYMQIHPGHALLEKRKPALMDSFLQSLLLAPLFVWFELLFLLGLYPKLYKDLQRRVDANLKQFRSQQKARHATGAAASLLPDDSVSHVGSQ